MSMTNFDPKLVLVACTYDPRQMPVLYLEWNANFGKDNVVHSLPLCIRRSDYNNFVCKSNLINQ